MAIKWRTVGDLRDLCRRVIYFYRLPFNLESASERLDLLISIREKLKIQSEYKICVVPPKMIAHVRDFRAIFVDT